jgi:hypothetical protein
MYELKIVDNEGTRWIKAADYNAEGGRFAYLEQGVTHYIPWHAVAKVEVWLATPEGIIVPSPQTHVEATAPPQAPLPQG